MPTCSLYGVCTVAVMNRSSFQLSRKMDCKNQGLKKYFRCNKVSFCAIGKHSGVLFKEVTREGYHAPTILPVRPPATPTQSCHPESRSLFALDIVRMGMVISKIDNTRYRSSILRVYLSKSGLVGWLAPRLEH